MDMPTPPNMAYQVQAPMPKRKMSSSVRLLIVALVVIFCIASLSVVANLLLYLKSNALKSDLGARIDALQTKNDGLAADLTALRTDNDALKGRLDTLESADIAAIRGDITKLQDVTKVPEIKFTISELKLTFESYTYEDDYYGEASVTCSDNTSDYLVLIKQTLNSGGTPGKDKVIYNFIDVVKGSGSYYTNDWNDKGKLVKPNYTIEVIGFLKLDVMSK